MAVQFVDDTEKRIFDRAKLGEDVRAFLASNPVGQLLHARSKAMIEQARLDALEIDPDGWGGWFRARRKLRQVRENAAVGAAIIDTLAQAIIDGNAATKELEDYR